MMHRNRIWRVAAVATAEELSEKLTEYTWCCCNGFRVVDTPYLFLNDATSADGAQAYAFVKEVEGGRLIQIESITCGWCTRAKALQHIQETLRGGFDESDFAREVKAVIQTPEDHGRCPHCA
jgi:hypothetical protein